MKSSTVAALLHLGQVAHDGAAQADQEAGKHQGHHPQAAVKPFFGQAQGFAHDDLPFRLTLLLIR
jgi:hypothetical protein